MAASNEEILNASEILFKVVTDQNVKLNYGSRQRTALKEMMDKGEKPNHYRMTWLKEARNDLIDSLQKIAEKFNKQFPHDACSVADLLDVLASTTHQFQTAVKRKEKNNSKD